MKNTIVLSVVRPAASLAEYEAALPRRNAHSDSSAVSNSSSHSRIWLVEPKLPANAAPKTQGKASPKNAAKPAEPSEPPMVRECWEIPIVYEDAHLLALNKPPQFLTSPDRTDRERPNLMTLLQQEITRGAGWVRERGISYLCNAHRLDFDSSGLLLLAKDKNTLVEMASMFGSFKPIQTFLALVHGVLPEPRVEVDAKLSPHLQRPGLMRVDMKNGKLSQTIFQTREAFRDFSLVECQPLTVRKDQVRVHLQCAKVALVADPIYGGPSLWLSQIKKHFRLKDGRVENPLINRPALHAERLAFKHPATGEEVRIEAPVAKDMAVAIKYLRRYGVPAGPTNPEESHPETGTDVA